MLKLALRERFFHFSSIQSVPHFDVGLYQQLKLQRSELNKKILNPILPYCRNLHSLFKILITRPASDCPFAAIAAVDNYS